VTAPARDAPRPELRHLVRGMLEDARAFPGLRTEQRQELARSLVQVLSYLSDPYAGLAPAAVAAAAPEARALDDANADLKGRLAKKQDLVGKDFKAGAGTEGAKVFKSLVSAVDFPAFVSQLIEGVYGSLVKSSISQMQEYMKLLAAVVKSVEEFAHDEVTPASARSFVAGSFPDAVELSDDGKLRLRDDHDGPPPDFKTVLEMKESVELDEETEERIVTAAQLKMARQRQQQLAMMVAMGINRIIVTDGEIKASVLFDMKAHDTADRRAQASTWDQTTDRTTSGGGWFDSSAEVQTKVSSAYSAEQDRSTADLETKAKLSGSVTVKFKSDVFPLERIASPSELGAVQEKSAR
jgi:hypothetical protein